MQGSMLGPMIGGAFANPCTVFGPSFPACGEGQIFRIRYLFQALCEGYPPCVHISMGMAAKPIVDQCLVTEACHCNIECAAPEVTLWSDICRPYFLPCLVASVVAVITLILSIIYVDETLPSLQKAPVNKAGELSLLVWDCMPYSDWRCPRRELQCQLTSAQGVHLALQSFHVNCMSRAHGGIHYSAGSAGVVELQERSQDKEERARLLAAKQRRPSARSYLDWEAGPDNISDSSSSEGVALCSPCNACLRCLVSTR